MPIQINIDKEEKSPLKIINSDNNFTNSHQNDGEAIAMTKKIEKINELSKKIVDIFSPVIPASVQWHMDIADRTGCRYEPFDPPLQTEELQELVESLKKPAEASDDDDDDDDEHWLSRTGPGAW